MSDEQPVPSEFPKTSSTYSGGNTGWSVEVRLSDHVEPREFGGMILSHKWKKFETHTSSMIVPEGQAIPITIPSKPSYGGALERFGLMEYPAAQALRWALHAHFDVISSIPGMGLETRLVEHDLTFSFSCTPVVAHCRVHGKDRSDIMPDWGSKRPLTKEKIAEMGLSI